MGSSAGAGSGEFHVYRHLRRKEYARQKSIQQKCVTEKLDQEYRDKIETNRLLCESKTAKKRAKRLKRKQKIKENAKKPKMNSDDDKSFSEESDNDDIDNSVEEEEVSVEHLKESMENENRNIVEETNSQETVKIEKNIFENSMLVDNSPEKQKPTDNLIISSNEIDN